MSEINLHNSSSNRSGRRYPENYRESEIVEIAGLTSRGISCCVIGTGGSGKSNFVRFLLSKPRSFISSFNHPLCLVHIDLNLLTDDRLVTFLRLMVRAFHDTCKSHSHQLLADDINMIYAQYKFVTDAFDAQTGLREMIQACVSHNMQIVIVFDRFSKLSQQTFRFHWDNLRAFRDECIGRLAYITISRRTLWQHVGSEQNAELPSDKLIQTDFGVTTEQLGELTELLDLYPLWLGPLAESDAIFMMKQLTPDNEPHSDAHRAELYELTAGHSALIKAATPTYFALRQQSTYTAAKEALLMLDSIRNRLKEIWFDLSEAEQEFLKYITHSGTVSAKSILRYKSTIAILQSMKLINEKRNIDQIQYSINGSMLEHHIKHRVEIGFGRISSNQQGQWQRGKYLLDLTKQQAQLLTLLTEHQPHTQITYRSLSKAWGERTVNIDLIKKAVQLLRKKLNVIPEQSYIVNWRLNGSRSEEHELDTGGYLFFPLSISKEDFRMHFKLSSANAKFAYHF